MDIPDYLSNSNADGKEWIIRKNLSSKWELRRIIEELEFYAEQYQMKKKYGDEHQELSEIEMKLKNLFEQSRQLSEQIRDTSS